MAARAVGVHPAVAIPEVAVAEVAHMGPEVGRTAGAVGRLAADRRDQRHPDRAHLAGVDRAVGSVADLLAAQGVALVADLGGRTDSAGLRDWADWVAATLRPEDPADRSAALGVVVDPRRNLP